MNNSNILVTINQSIQIFSIIKVDLSTYFLEINFVENIEKNSILQVYIRSNLTSQNNSLLSTQNLNTTLYARTLGGIRECFESTYSNCYDCAIPMSLCNSRCYCNINHY